MACKTSRKSAPANLPLLLALAFPVGCGDSDELEMMGSSTGDQLGDESSSGAPGGEGAGDESGTPVGESSGDGDVEGSSDDGSDGLNEVGVCGDGIVDPGEVCDDGVNDGSYGGCEPGCGAISPFCGDGIVQNPEVCDDGENDGAYGGCQAGCGALASFCGDGVTDDVEPCDDGNDAINDGCNPDCTEPGETLWETSWNDPELSLWETSPAALAIMPDGHVQLAATEWLENGEENAVNVTFDLLDGTVISVDRKLSEDGYGYRVYAGARVAAGTVLAGSRYNGGSEAVIYRTNNDGAFVGTFIPQAYSSWSAIATEATTGHVAVTDGTLVRAYDGSLLVFEYAPANLLMDPHVLAYVDQDLHVAGQNDIYGGLSVNRLGPDGELEDEAFWNEPPDLGNTYANAMVATSDGGVLVAGAFHQPGSTNRSFIVKFGAGMSVAWSNYEGSQSPSSEWRAACESPSGDLYAIGRVYVDNAIGWQDRIRKLSADGEMIWSRLLDEEEDVVWRDAIACDEAGGAVIAGSQAPAVWYARLAP